MPTASEAKIAPSSLWRWEDFTADAFTDAVHRADRTCVLPIGCLERHGSHLPLGTDVFEARAIAEQAVREEPAIIFPSYYFAQISEARHKPGTISYTHSIRWAMLEETIDEIVRNGMNRILILNGHGGNIHFLNYFAQCQLERCSGAQVYVAWPWFEHPDVSRVLESTHDGHGGEIETSLMLRVAPELVRRDAHIAPGDALDRVPTLTSPGIMHALHWYARYPEHYAGDGAAGTIAKGDVILSAYGNRVAAMLRAIKTDSGVVALDREFRVAAVDPLGMR